MAVIGHFTSMDYIVFGGMMGISTLIGVYHGLRARRVKTSHASHFLTAGGNISTFPVALSLLSSFLSSVTLMGHPSEIYLYGTQNWLFGPTTFLVVPVVGYYLVPFFRKHNYVSVYQYLGERFNRRIQNAAAFLFSCHVVFFLAIVVYAPALAVQQATGFDIMSIVTLCYVICIFYTIVGGIKAVVWTDAFQMVVIFVSLIAVVIKGTMEVGGVSVVWERNAMFNRTVFFNWNFDLTERFTFWSALIGSTVSHIALYGGNQLQVQRYFTVPTVKHVQKMLWINAVGWTIIISIGVYTGMLIFAHYLGCDPLLSNRITKADQLFPLYVIESLNEYPGFTGIFMCAIFSAALSTMSTGMNSLAAVWFIELDGTKFKSKLSDEAAGRFVKWLALFFGLLSYFCVFLVPHLGGLIAMNMTFLSIGIGSLFGLFLLGMACPNANSMGAGTGLLASVVLMSWITVGGMFASSDGFEVNQQPLPTSLSTCSANYTGPIVPQAWWNAKPKAFTLYRISYLWYNPIAISTCVVFGFIGSVLWDLVRRKEILRQDYCNDITEKEIITKTALLKPEIV